MTTKGLLKSGPSFRSLGPNVPDTTIDKTKLSNYHRTFIDEDKIFKSLYDLITNMTNNIDEVNAGTSPDNYKWSMYEQLGIPQYSFTQPEYLRRLRIPFKRLNYRGPIRSYFQGNPGNGVLDTFFGGSNIAKFDNFPHQPSNMFLSVNLNKSKNGWGGFQPYDYKIHICVKEEYALYTILKLMLYIKNKFPNKFRNSKLIMNHRASHLLNENAIFSSVDFDGGFIETIVLYTNTADPAVVRDTLSGIIDLFPEEDIIGNMPLTGSKILPFANIRLNHMLCYTQGDRSAKVDRMQYDKASSVAKPGYFSPRRDSSRKIFPEWFNTMKSQCKTSKEAINKNSELFFGFPLCDTDKTFSDKCTDVICYMAAKYDFLDPNSILNNKYRTAILDTVSGGKRHRNTRKRISKRRCKYTTRRN